MTIFEQVKEEAKRLSLEKEHETVRKKIERQMEFSDRITTADALLELKRRGKKNVSDEW